MSQYVKFGDDQYATIINTQYIEFVRDCGPTTIIQLTSGEVHKIHADTMSFTQVLSALGITA